MAETRKLAYEARIGGSDSPIFCGHRHVFVDAAAACVAQRGGVYEDADGIFTDSYYVVDKTAPQVGMAGSVKHVTGSLCAGKTRSDLGIT